MRRQGRRFESVSTWWLTMALLLASLSGCGNQDDIYPPNAVYRVTVANLTFNQFFSPVAVIIHTPGYKAWECVETDSGALCQKASEEIERLAEGGELARGTSSDHGKWLLDEAAKDPAVVLARVTVDSATGLTTGIFGGGRARVSMSVPPGQDYRLTVATGLMFTNDGFTGVTDLHIGQLQVGEILTQYTDAYDAGTEANTETDLTVPGFALFYGKEAIGFVPRPLEDETVITPHTGVITADEPLGDPPDQERMAIRDGSGLNETHRFLQPVAKIIVERLS